jgi:hypothetical protein
VGLVMSRFIAESVLVSFPGKLVGIYKKNRREKKTNLEKIWSSLQMPEHHLFLLLLMLLSK